MKHYLFWTCLLLLPGLACNSPEEKPAVQLAPFFDLKSYFAEEVKSLSDVRDIQKTTWINGEEESHTFDSLDFTQELSVFVDSDINRVAWLDQYQVDSVFAADGSLTSLSYGALNPELKTREVKIDFVGEKPSFIQIKKLSENALMNASMLLEYTPGKSYRIQSNQKLRIAEEREMIVEVTLH